MSPDGKVNLRNLNLTVLPPLPEGILSLDCFRNQLTSLPELPALQELTCSDNNLTRLPELPESLLELICNQNQLTSLPELPASLEYLTCSENNLTGLPELPASLLTLNCSGNKLTRLPELPASLMWIDCKDNKLTSLPELPAALHTLNCSGNKLTKLPELPASLQYLYCNNSPLVEPFATYYDTYNRTNDIDQLRESIHKYYEITRKARNVLEAKRAMGRKGYNPRFPSDVDNYIAAFLTGKTLPSGTAKPINQQLAELRANAGVVGRSPKKGAIRRRRRKGGKSKKRYHK